MKYLIILVLLLQISYILGAVPKKQPKKVKEDEDGEPEKGPKLIDRLKSEETKQLAKSAVGTIPGILGQTAKYSLAPALLGVLLGPPGIVAGAFVGGSYGFAKGSINGIKKVQEDAKDIKRAQNPDFDKI